MSEQIELFSIPSPCKRICQTDQKGYCLGCFRSRDERFNWMNFSDEQKREVIRLCKQRALRKRYLKWKEEQAKLTVDNGDQLDLL